MFHFPFNREQFQEQLETRLSLKRDLWSKWDTVRILPSHILIHLKCLAILPAMAVSVVWSMRDGTVSVWPDGLGCLGQFAQLVQDEGLTIADNLYDILQIFWFSQLERRLIQSVDEIKEEIYDSEKRALLSKYEGMIRPPICSLNETEQQVTFWAHDWESGDLEEWQFVQKEGNLTIQHWAREECLKPFHRL